MGREAIDYSQAAVAVRADLGETHSRYWHRLARAGSWWSGAERIAIANETRQATDQQVKGLEDKLDMAIATTRQLEI